MTEAVLMKAMHTIESICKKDFQPLETEEWIRRFSDVTDEEFLNAYNAYMDTMDNTFLPAPGSIKKHIIKAREKRRTKLIPEVGEAVAEVRASIRNYGNQPEYSHPIIDALVNRVGYRRLCENTCEENQRLLTWTYKEMRENYIDSDREEYTDEAERRFLERQAKEQKRLEARNTGRRYLGAG